MWKHFEEDIYTMEMYDLLGSLFMNYFNVQLSENIWTT